MQNKELEKRLEVAIKACETAGKMLLDLRDNKDPFKTEKHEEGQLKSEVDVKSENLIISILKKNFPNEPILAEEKWEQDKEFVHTGSYWILDALDGTRSFHEGYDGFCVQLAFVENSELKIGIVVAPVFGEVFYAIKGEGAYLKKDNKNKQLFVKEQTNSNLIYTDNHPSFGLAKKVLDSLKATTFFESGSIGLKICRVADGTADIFLKPVKFKTWDVAMGHLILNEAGGRLTLLNGNNIDYSAKQIYYDSFIAANNALLHEKALKEIKKYEKQ